jgi:hypothetical protein
MIISCGWFFQTHGSRRGKSPHGKNQSDRMEK